jgi:hypothetical protein
MIVDEATSRIYASVATDCKHNILGPSCTWHIYALDVRDLRRDSRLSLGPVSAVDERRGRLFASRGHSIVAIRVKTQGVLWDAKPKNCSSAQIDIVPQTGNVWTTGYSPPTKEYASGVAHFCLLSGATGRTLHEADVPQADAACIGAVDAPGEPPFSRTRRLGGGVAPISCSAQRTGG